MERPERGSNPGHAGVGPPPRTNDIDLDEAVEDTDRWRGGKKRRTHGLAIGFSNPGKYALCCDDR